VGDKAIELWALGRFRDALSPRDGVPFKGPWRMDAGGESDVSILVRRAFARDAKDLGYSPVQLRPGSPRESSIPVASVPAFNVQDLGRKKPEDLVNCPACREVAALFCCARPDEVGAALRLWLYGRNMALVEEFLPRTQDAGEEEEPRFGAELAEAHGDIAGHVLAEVYRAWRRPRAHMAVRDMQRRFMLCAHDYLVGHRSTQDQEMDPEVLQNARTTAWEDLSNALAGAGTLEVPRAGGALMGVEILSACTAWRRDSDSFGDVDSGVISKPIAASPSYPEKAELTDADQPSRAMTSHTGGSES
jgi:hypothetical protein